MRYRTRGSQAIQSVVYEQYYPISCSNRTVSSVGTYLSVGYLGSKEITLDENTPGWWKRRGKSFTFNYYSNDKFTAEVIGTSDVTFTSVANACTSPNIKSWTHDWGAWFSQWLAPSAIPSGLLPVSATDKNNLAVEIYTRCLANRQKGQANFIETLAELDKAWGMVGSPLENARKFVDNFRANGRRKRGYKKVAANSRDLIRFVSSEYLRFRYGIMPIISDCRAAMKALERGYEKKPIIHKARASGSLDATSFTTSFLVNGANSVRINYQLTSRNHITCRATFLDSYRAHPLQQLGFTLQNVLSVWWELTRYSFVVDWFTNVGDVIYANMPRASVVPLGGCLVTQDEFYDVWQPTLTYSPNGAYTVSGGASDILKKTRISRWREPKGTNAFGIVINSDFRFDQYTRCADAAALLLQRLGSIRFG